MASGMRIWAGMLFPASNGIGLALVPVSSVVRSEFLDGFLRRLGRQNLEQLEVSRRAGQS